jgi:hypothetical protein
LETVLLVGGVALCPRLGAIDGDLLLHTLFSTLRSLAYLLAFRMALDTLFFSIIGLNYKFWSTSSLVVHPSDELLQQGSLNRAELIPAHASTNVHLRWPELLYYSLHVAEVYSSAQESPHMLVLQQLPHHLGVLLDAAFAALSQNSSDPVGLQNVVSLWQIGQVRGLVESYVDCIAHLAL